MLVDRLRAHRKLVFFALGVLLLGVFTSWLFVLESRTILTQKITAWTDDQKGDCAVVLTGSPGRVREGFDLIAQGRVRKLIISGVYPQAELLDIFPQLPYYGPINEGDVVLEKRSLTTYGNAQQTQPLVEALQCKDIILVTSRLHMYRSLKIFHSVFPADFEIKPRAVIASQVDPDFFELALEVTKSLFYRLWAY